MPGTFTSGRPGEVNADPSFLPDGRILYVHSEGSSNAFELWVMSRDGSNRQRLLAPGSGLEAINDPTASPDGTTLVFEGRVGSASGKPVYNLFAMALSEPSALVRLTQEDGEADIWPSFSPDGEYLTYFTYEWQRNGGHLEKVRVCRRDGSEEQVLSSFPWESFPAWYLK